MRRIALRILLVSVSVVAGCQNAKPTAAPLQSAELDYGLQPEFYVTDGAASGGLAEANVTPPEYGSVAPSSSPEPLSLSAPVQRTHVVAKGDTLFGLARQYFNDASRWNDIYQANLPALASPHVLRVGQELVIP